ncbi:MAG: FAD-dependent oxidoreductase [Clostridia bacterium]|nr:FAD-dependent oxidoreductase [Clostridia bacterium]
MKTDAFVQQLVDGYGNWVQSAENENRAGGTGRMTNALYPYERLFSPITINRTTIKNRLVMAPMGNIDMCEETGRPNDKMLQYFFARAKGGVGLITTGLIPISHGIDNSITELGHLSYFPRIDRSRTVLSGWRDLAQGVHAFGSKIFVQLTPGLGRVGNPQCLITQIKLPVSASWNPNFYISQIPCMPLSGAKLNKIIKNAGQAAADAKACGLDGVYLHGHEGYLLEQLTNPAFNRRKLGKYADYQRFGIDLVKELRKRSGERYPIMYRIDLSLALNETYGEQGMQVSALKKFRNGRSIEQTLEYMENLVKAGVDIFDVDLGCYDNWWLPHPPSGMPAGCFVDVAEMVRNRFKNKNVLSNAGVPVPIVAVGKLGYPDLAEQALRDGKCDMVMLGRPLLADPEWPNKAFAGRVDAIRPCIGCQEGCINEFVDGGHPQCAVNPRTGFEDVMPELPAPSEARKHIAVIGAGPAGVVFAVSAARRGHKVELFEKGARIGGKVLPGSVPRIKYDLENYLRYLERQLLDAEKNFDLKLHLNEEATCETLKKRGFDAIVFAAGTRSGTPPLPGLEKIPHIEATELLISGELPKDVKKAVIVGGGVVGCETAYWLSYEKGVDVKVVEMLPHFMHGSCTANRGHLIHYMKENGVELINCATVKGFDEKHVLVERNTHKNVPNPYNTWQPILPENIENPLAPKLGSAPQAVELEADLVVLAMGGRPDEDAYLEALSERAAPELYNIGDSFAAGRVLEATRAAYALAARI